MTGTEKTAGNWWLLPINRGMELPEHAVRAGDRLHFDLDATGWTGPGLYYISLPAGLTVPVTPCKYQAPAVLAWLDAKPTRLNGLICRALRVERDIPRTLAG